MKTKRINEDYQIRIYGSKNGNAFWRLLRKDEPAACNEEEIRMVSKTLGEIKDKIDKQYPPFDH